MSKRNSGETGWLNADTSPAKLPVDFVTMTKDKRPARNRVIIIGWLLKIYDSQKIIAILMQPWRWQKKAREATVGRASPSIEVKLGEKERIKSGL